MPALSLGEASLCSNGQRLRSPPPAKVWSRCPYTPPPTVSVVLERNKQSEISLFCLPFPEFQEKALKPLHHLLFYYPVIARNCSRLRLDFHRPQNLGILVNGRYFFRLSCFDCEHIFRRERLMAKHKKVERRKELDRRRRRREKRKKLLNKEQKSRMHPAKRVRPAAG
jgi:hypothetical protein